MSTAAVPELTEWQYRWLDRITKLLGVALIAAGLDIGGGTLTGILLATAGIASGLCTVVIPTNTT